MPETTPEPGDAQADDSVREFCRRFVDYVTADGFSVGQMVTRMERLKFETIVTGKSYREVLAEPATPEDGCGQLTPGVALDRWHPPRYSEVKGASHP